MAREWTDLLETARHYTRRVTSLATAAGGIHEGMAATNRLHAALVFLAQSIVVGLAVAFLVVLVRPDLLPAVGPANRGAPASYADAIEKSADAVANVYIKRLVAGADTDSGRARFQVNTSFASAVVIDPEGYLVTNYHVVAQAAEIRVQFSDGRVAEPDIVGVDRETDLALLRVDIGRLPAIEMGSSADLSIGDVVLAIGNPYGLTKSVTFGIVSATGRGLLNLATFENFIQTDAAINAGNSGGALVDSEGALVGINTAVLAQDAGTEGISFAIPVDLVRGVVSQIRAKGRVVRGWLGLQTDDLTTAEKAALGLEANAGILLVDVYADSPAARAGLRRGDIILSVDGETIGSRRQAQLLVAGSAPGDEIDIAIARDGVRIEAVVTTGERPEEVPAIEPPDQPR